MAIGKISLALHRLNERDATGTHAEAVAAIMPSLAHAVCGCVRTLARERQGLKRVKSLADVLSKQTHTLKWRQEELQQTQTQLLKQDTRARH